jgi:predicted  nucleic acid-binding Zn-ribbon protein
MQLATCSHDLSQQKSARATSLISRDARFGRSEGVPLEQRSPRVRPWRSLSALHPDLVGELHPDLNPDVSDSAAVAAQSQRRVWWRCQQCGHEWQTTVGSRSAGHGCPQCYNQRRRGPRRVPAEQSLQALHPAVAREWDRQRNRALDPGTISPNSKQKVWWHCATCGQQWQASVQNRARGHGCPTCAVTRRAQIRSRVEYDQSLAALYPELARQLDRDRNPGLDPEQLGAHSGQKVWWRCETCGHGWRTAVSTRTKGSGCPVCGLKRRARTQSYVEPARSLAVKHPTLAAELHASRNPEIDPERLAARSGLKVWWQCSTCGHEWRTAVSTRTDGSGCPACYQARQQKGTSCMNRGLCHRPGSGGQSPPRASIASAIAA